MTVDSEQISEVMRELGRRGGKIGGKRRLETMTAEARSAVARKAGLKSAEAMRMKKAAELKTVAAKSRTPTVKNKAIKPPAAKKKKK